MRTPILAGSTLALISLLASAAAYADVKVGVTAAVNPVATGQPPAAPERMLLVGIENFANEKITTGPAGEVQLLFVDGSSISVGPDADLTIDEYVYDTKTKTGKFAVTAAQGVFRVVGGAISKSDEVRITMPTMTVGIRGGIGVFSSRPNEPSTATFLFGGSLRVTANGETQSITRPGFQVTVLPGQPPSPPVRITTEDMRAVLANFQGRRGGGQIGGQGGEAAQDAALAKSNVSSATGSKRPPQTLAGVGPSNTFNPNANNVTSNIVTAASNAGATNAAVSAGVVSASLSGHFYAAPLFDTLDPKTGIVTYTPSSSSSELAAFALTGSGAQERLAFVLPTGPGESQTFGVLFLPGQTYSTGPFPVRSGPLAGGTALGNVIVSPDSQVFLVVGQITPPAGQTCGKENCAFAFFGGKPTQANASSPFPTSGYATYNVQAVNPPANAATVPFSSLASPSPGSAGLTISPMYTAFGANQPGASSISTNLQSSLWIQGSGANQRSGLVIMTSTFFQEQGSTIAMQGGVVGMSRDCPMCVLKLLTSGAASAPIASTSGSGLTYGNAIFGPNANYIVAVPDIFTPQQNAGSTRANGAAQVTPYDTLQSNGPDFVLTYAAQTGFSPTSSIPRTDTSASSTLGSYQGYTGGTMDIRSSNGTITPGMFMTKNSPGVSIGTNPTNNRVGATFNFTDLNNNDSYSLLFGDHVSPQTFGTRSAFINDLIFGARDSRDINGNPLSTLNGQTVSSNSLAMVTYQTAPVDFQSFAGQGVTACTCAFMTWGWWIGQVQNPSGNSLVERFQLSTWVAGVLPSTAEINAQTGTATYNGHVIGNVAGITTTPATEYIAAGNLQATWNFASHTGTWTASNFDRGGVVNSNGYSFSGGIRASAGSPNFSGGVSGPNGSSGSVFGSFYKNLANGDPVAGVGGSWSLANAAFKAAGTFAGQR